MLFIYPQFTLAGNLYCRGTIKNLYVDNSNMLIVHGSWRADYTKLCNTAGDDNVNAQTCALWASILMKSVTDNKEVIVKYPNVDGSASCNNLLTFHNSPSPYYVMLVK